MSALPPLPPPLDPTLRAYTLQGDLSRWPWGELLAPFSPPLPRDGQVVLASLFADVFVRDGAGAVHWVNGHHSRVDIVALSQQQFEQRLAAEHVAFLKSTMVDMLTVAGRGLPEGRLYGLLKPVQEGGRWAIENVGTASLADAFAYHGSRFVPPPEPAAPESAKAKKKGWFN